MISATIGGLVLASGAPVGAEPPPDGPDVAHLALPSEVEAEVDESLRLADGPVDVVVRLVGPSLAEAVGPGAKQRGPRLDTAGQRALLARTKQDQNAVARSVRGLGGVELGRVSKALNAVVATVDADRIDELAATPGVASVRPLGTYETHLSDTVPYVGARSGPFADLGADGGGVTVAVLDSGIDYTHAALGGAGTAEAYAAAYGANPSDPANTTVDGLFPTAKVVGGYDFVGESWPSGPLAPDPDPIDYEGHGTHVADIVAGASGMAPGADLLAVKVCSAVGSSCSGLALLQGMDFALDPDGDGDIADAVDVINMSLGSNYGQIEDDLSFASQNAVDLGVTVVASAGNSANRPYITGSPASTPGVISVAQTQVPSAVAYPVVMTGIGEPSTLVNTATLDWAPVGSGFTGEVVRLGESCPGQAYFAGNSPAGKVALIDRGVCNISLKVDRATRDGAVAVLIANSTPGDAPTFSFGGGQLPMVPAMVITQSDGNRIKAALGAAGLNPAVTATVSDAVTVPLAGSMVASSSRGPSMSFDAIKPEIGAPGASVSAVAGSGDGTQAFGGTSGAAPVVAGAAALLLSLDPSLYPLSVKSRLVGTGETNILTNPQTRPGVLAPITRIGGGEVRVDAAARASTIAFDAATRQPSLSFGYLTATGTTTVQRTLTIRNVSDQTRTYTVTPTFRYENDRSSGAVTASVAGNNRTRLAPGAEATVTVRLTVDPTRLPAWTLGGASMGNGELLDGLEFDGYLLVSGGGETVHVPWQVLPRAAAATSADRPVVNVGTKNTVTLSNRSAVTGLWDAFALTGTSEALPTEAQPGAGDELAVIDLRSVGVRAGGGVLQFAVSTWDERSHPAYPAGFEIQLDVNRDGAVDWFVYNAELNGFGQTGTAAVYVQQAGTNFGSAYYFLDADPNSSNRILTVPLSAVGITAATQFDFTVLAYDNYFTGLVSDVVGPMRYTAGQPRYVLSGGLADGQVPAGGSVSVAVTATDGGATASPSQSGILLMHRGNAQGREATTVTVRP